LGPQPLNASEAAAPKNLRPGYIPESMDMKTWLVSLRDCYATLQYGLLDYVVQHKARMRVLDPNQWVREVDLNPIMSTILDYVFLEKIGKEPFDFDALIIPKLQDLRVPMDVGLPLVHEVVMYVVSTIGNIFPEMYFGPDVRISYEIVSGNDLWISTTKDPVD
jgi:hypothetical protein